MDYPDFKQGFRFGWPPVGLAYQTRALADCRRIQAACGKHPPSKCKNRHKLYLDDKLYSNRLDMERAMEAAEQTRLCHRKRIQGAGGRHPPMKCKNHHKLYLDDKLCSNQLDMERMLEAAEQATVSCTLDIPQLPSRN